MGTRASGRNIADAKVKHITQVIFGRSAIKGVHQLFYPSAVHRFLREAPSVDVHIVTHDDAAATTRRCIQPVTTFAIKALWYQIPIGLFREYYYPR